MKDAKKIKGLGSRNQRKPILWEDLKSSLEKLEPHYIGVSLGILAEWTSLRGAWIESITRAMVHALYVMVLATCLAPIILRSMRSSITGMGTGHKMTLWHVLTVVVNINLHGPMWLARCDSIAVVDHAHTTMPAEPLVIVLQNISASNVVIDIRWTAVIDDDDDMWCSPWWWCALVVIVLVVF